MTEPLEVSKWMKYAERDLEIAVKMASEYPEDSVFHCQQAAEKALKAVFIKKFGELIKTHELVFLARKVGLPEELLIDCKDLNESSAATRYPGYEEVITAFTPDSAMKAAGRLVVWSRKQL